MAHFQELITDHQEKLILIKKNNAIYLDDFVRDKPNERLSAEIREQELHFRSEQEDGQKLVVEINKSLARQKKLSDKLTQAALLRKDIVNIIEKMLKTKNLSPN